MEVANQIVPGQLAPVPPAVHNAVAEAEPLVPWDVMFPKKNEFRDALVKHALPRVLKLLKDPARRLASPRDIVNDALDMCKSEGDVFWGAYGVYSRRRSACDAILSHYMSTLQDYAAGRPFAAV